MGNPMRRFAPITAALALVLALGGASPALAAGEKPSPELDRFYFRLAAGPRTLRQYVNCQVKHGPELARRIFDSEYGSATQAQLLNALLDDDNHNAPCLFVATEVRSNSLMYLGALAEELIERDKPAPPAPVVWSAGSTSDLGGGTHLWTWRNLTNAAAARSIPLSYCLLGRHADQVQGVLETRPNANGERELFNGLNDEIDACIPSGQTWTLQPQILRAAFAIAYYQSARAAGANASNGAAE
jgi:hypothetical protein